MARSCVRRGARTPSQRLLPVSDAQPDLDVSDGTERNLYGVERYQAIRNASSNEPQTTDTRLLRQVQQHRDGDCSHTRLYLSQTVLARELMYVSTPTIRSGIRWTTKT